MLAETSQSLTKEGGPVSELLVVKNLKKYFPVRRGIFSGQKLYSKAVDDISFTINRGETFGLVGES